MEKETLNLNSEVHEFIQMNISSEYSITKASEDASFRKYFRVQDKDKTIILMVAPPDKEPLDQFLFIAKSLKASVPAAALHVYSKLATPLMHFRKR